MQFRKKYVDINEKNYGDIELTGTLCEYNMVNGTQIPCGSTGTVSGRLIWNDRKFELHYYEKGTKVTL